ncbi:hypothetical protein [Bacillus stratosphericus]|uniref:hypothetical protein n=1 Tax=Bacillus stratosphericus TaxID=293386 RepID=UPI001CFA5A67|nr:hypothetical protein [Bacillus stratosphericus]
MNCTCPFCGSELHDKKDGKEKYFCDFCVMDITKNQAQTEGHRIEEEHKEDVNLLDSRETTPVLMTYSTWSLILLLKEVRKRRAILYKATLNAEKYSRGYRDKQKADDIASEFQDVTKRMYIIENILKKRLSYIPDNLRDSYLRDYEKHMSNKKTNDKMLTFTDSDGEV